MEIWAWCAPCRRWFYCPAWFDRTQPHPCCPLCDAEPTAIENRERTPLARPARP